MSNRRVLWFINKVPLGVAQAAGMPSVRGGWLDSYIEIMSDVPSVDLTVAFPDGTGCTPKVKIGGVTFIGLPAGDPGSGVGGVVGRWRHEVAPSNVLAAAADLVRTADPDLIHLHGAELCFGLAVHDSRVPTVLSIQGSPTVIRRLYLRGVDSYYLRSLSLAEFLKGWGPVHEHVKMKPQAANEAATMASVGHVAGRTEWDRRLALVMAPQAIYHRCEEPMRLAFHRASWQADAAQPGRIISTSGHYALKGVGTLLRAVDIVRRTAPETTLVLVGVAHGTLDDKAAMRHIRALGMEECVTVMGELDAESVAQQLTQANVFVNPSHMENSSSALSEAQLVGVPCVASSAGGMTTLADQGSAALLFQDGDAEALAGALLSLMNDPDEAARLGGRGRTLASARHDPERIRAQILSMYDEMLA